MKSGKPTICIYGGLRYGPPDGMVVNHPLLAALIRVVYIFLPWSPSEWSLTLPVISFFADLINCYDGASLHFWHCYRSQGIRIVGGTPFFILVWIAAPFLRTVAIVKYAMGFPDDSNNVNRIPTGRMSALA
uniref:Uncharacterized protein n=1 Tax=Oryza punctata TaxID=4537 RepID=A0A0E0JSZ4_ORYPU